MTHLSPCSHLYLFINLSSSAWRLRNSFFNLKHQSATENSLKSIQSVTTALWFDGSAELSSSVSISVFLDTCLSAKGFSYYLFGVFFLVNFSCGNKPNSCYSVCISDRFLCSQTQPFYLNRCISSKPLVYFIWHSGNERACLRPFLKSVLSWLFYLKLMFFS